MTPVVLAATPIGNAQDASVRLRDLLSTADVIAAEDTRRLRDLTRRIGVSPTGRIVSHHEHNEASRIEELLAVAREGGTVAVVSDAGMPTVSDPGLLVVRAAIAEGIEVTVLPGPSAVLTALALSGLPTDRFCFEGFVPRKAGSREAALQDLAAERRTLVFFEAPHRLAQTLAAMLDAFGDRQAAVCRELTKTFEEVRRGPLSDLADWAAGEVRGEIVIVVGGAPTIVGDIPALVPQVLARVDRGERLKDVTADLAKSASVARRALYDAAVAARSGQIPS